jgi:YggT family protein
MTVGSVAWLVDTAFAILELLVFARVMLSWFPISPWNPIARWLRRIVDPILRPFRRVLPSFSGIDFSPLLALATIYVVQRIVVSLLVTGSTISPGLAVLSVVRQVALAIAIFFCIVLFIRVLFSLFHADPWHPLVMALRRLTDPMVRPFAGLVPRGAGVDGAAAIAFVLFLALYFAGRALFDALGVY